MGPERELEQARTDAQHRPYDGETGTQPVREARALAVVRVSAHERSTASTARRGDACGVCVG